MGRRWAGVAAALLWTASVAAQTAGEDAFLAELSPTGKQLVVEVNKVHGGDLRPVCNLDARPLAAEIVAAHRRLVERGELQGGPGYYTMEVSSYYHKRCRTVK